MVEAGLYEISRRSRVEQLYGTFPPARGERGAVELGLRSDEPAECVALSQQRIQTQQLPDGWMKHTSAPTLPRSHPAQPPMDDRLGWLMQPHFVSLSPPGATRLLSYM